MKNQITHHPIQSKAHAIKRGYSPLDAQAIKDKVIGNYFLGGYLRGFKYIIALNNDGSLEGKNNVEHYDTGRWSINETDNTLSVEWDFGWDNACTHAFLFDNEIILFDKYSGEWRTSLTHRINPEANIKTYQFNDVLTTQ